VLAGDKVYVNDRGSTGVGRCRQNDTVCLLLLHTDVLLSSVERAHKWARRRDVQRSDVGGDLDVDAGVSGGVAGQEKDKVVLSTRG